MEGGGGTGRQREANEAAGQGLQGGKTRRYPCCSRRYGICRRDRARQRELGEGDGALHVDWDGGRAASAEVCVRVRALCACVCVWRVCKCLCVSVSVCPCVCASTRLCSLCARAGVRRRVRARASAARSASSAACSATILPRNPPPAARMPSAMGRFPPPVRGNMSRLP